MVRHNEALFWLFLVLSSCNLILGEDDKLTFNKEYNFSGRIKLEGYYYKEIGAQFNSDDCYFLYRNGIIMSIGVINTDSARQILNDKFEDKLRNIKYVWGLYQIKGDSISFEKWYPSSGPPKVTFIRKGVILNDSTFVIRSLMRSNGEDKSAVEEYYHFRKFSPKPDSTNKFIP